MNAIFIGGLLLQSLATQPAPWLQPEANSEQRQPVYFGATPLEMELGLPHSPVLTLPSSLRDLAEQQLALVLGHGDLQVEAWPVRDDYGQLTWAFARWRNADSGDWSWFDSREASTIFFPQVYRPWKTNEHQAIFADVLSFPELYAKPVFGDCIWTDEAGLQSVGAWFPTDQAASFARSLGGQPLRNFRPVCRVLPQPARHNGQAFSLVLDVLRENHGFQVKWPVSLRWSDSSSASTARPPLPVRGGVAIQNWSKQMEKSYREDVGIFAGEKTVRFPLSAALARFTRKNNADPANQLENVVNYLAERYEKLGLRTTRQRFRWRGRWHSNLIAIIPGSLPDSSRTPVLLADHIDTAFSEDAFDHSGRRIAAPGADDNASATAAILRAAEILPALRPLHDIWLVHLTGEEFPADDLGARKLVGKLLREGQATRGVILLDMIGYDPRNEGIFQINAGDSLEAEAMAVIARDAARTVAPHLRSLLRSRFDPRSYLYNTDGLIFSDAGFPVILLNEHINRLENLDRPHYHQTTDRSGTIRWPYALGIARIAIETAARLATTP